MLMVIGEARWGGEGVLSLGIGCGAGWAEGGGEMVGD